MKNLSLTYGVLPSFEVFKAHYEAAMIEDGKPADHPYRIRQARLGNDGAAWHGDYDAEELYERCKEETDTYNALTEETAQSYDEEQGIGYVSCILTTLGIEWV